METTKVVVVLQPALLTLHSLQFISTHEYVKESDDEGGHFTQQACLEDIPMTCHGRGVNSC